MLLSFQSRSEVLVSKGDMLIELTNLILAKTVDKAVVWNVGFFQKSFYISF